MKKIIAVCMMVVMLLCFGVNAFAAVGGFVSSPSGNAAPQLMDYSTGSDDCEATVVITPYSERDDLPEDSRLLMGQAYEHIVNNPNLSKLNPELSKVADEKNIDVTKLSVSDLFDIDLTHCDDHDGHGNLSITLKPDTLKNFVALMYFNGEEWVIVEDAKVDGEHLLFSTNVSGPYAIVVNTGAASTDTPQTGDNSKVALYVVIMLVSAGALLVLWRKLKKQSV